MRFLGVASLTGQRNFRSEALRMCSGANVNCHSAFLVRSAPTATSTRHRRVITGCSGLVEECSRQDWNKPLAAVAGVAEPVCVALGKFDAMHQGHCLLAQQAASSGSSPFLLSFSGMAEILGWPARLPLVAASDRARVLASWTPKCHGRTPRQRYIPFAMVRTLSPEAFVQSLVEDLQVSGIVVGQNYRFGYKAAGDSALLQALGSAHGIQVDIVNLVEAGQGGVVGQVSSSKIRSALNQGHMRQVAESLGRPYRLVADVSPQLLRPDCISLRLPVKCLHNQPPMYNQTYQVTLSVADSHSAGCKDTEDYLPHLLSMVCSYAADNAGFCKEGSMQMTEKGIMLCKDLSIWLQQSLAGGHGLIALDFL